MHNGAGIEKSTHHRIPLDPELPSSAFETAQEVATDQTRQEEAVFERRRESALKHVDTIRRQARELFSGDADYLRFREFLRTERLRVRDLMLPPEGLTADSAAIRRDRHQRAAAFLRECGVSSDQFTRILNEYRDGMANILESPLDVNSGTVYSVNRFQEMEESKIEPRAFTIRPPFDGWQRGWHFANLAGNGFTGDRFVTLVPESGIVGHQVQVMNLDASDFDFAEAVADAQVAFWFTPGVTGTVRMTIEVQCQLATHSLRTVDEWGTSESSTTQTNFLMMHVLHPNVAGPSFAATSDFVWRTDETQEVFRQFIPTGATVVGRLSSNGTVPANQPVVIRAGTRTIASSFTNDVEIHSTPDFRWVINLIAIQIV
ncbi:hypothetical protein [Streptomyces galilaeus]|uniref:hypothetical protein n=1 Tax=Streptomyces galilaeus TaxID=33899 RepID=UPI0016733F42|nr:hypothetical protein [Streptomyces galilaeus]GGW82395.1 hypothetical protein GCM10010350_79020 [Streptomyces galilaeus]